MRDSRQKREVESPKNWSRLGEEWLQARDRVEDQFGVALLPASEKVRNLSAFSVANFTEMTDEQLKRVKH